MVFDGVIVGGGGSGLRAALQLAQSGLKTDERQATAPLAQVFKRAETEKELEARRLSHAYFQEQQEAEPWSDVRLFPADSEESIKLRQQLFGLDEPHDV